MTEKQLGYKDICEEMRNDPGPLIGTIHKATEKIIGEWPKVCTLLLARENSETVTWCLFQVDLLFQTETTRLKTYLFFRISSATFHPGSKILHKR